MHNVRDQYDDSLSFTQIVFTSQIIAENIWRVSIEEKQFRTFKLRFLSDINVLLSRFINDDELSMLWMWVELLDKEDKEMCHCHCRPSDAYSFHSMDKTWPKDHRLDDYRSVQLLDTSMLLNLDTFLENNMAYNPSMMSEENNKVAYQLEELLVEDKCTDTMYDHNCKTCSLLN